MATERITITLDTDLLIALRERAKKEHRPISNLISHLITEILEKMEEENHVDK